MRSSRATRRTTSHGTSCRRSRGMTFARSRALARPTAARSSSSPQPRRIPAPGLRRWLAATSISLAPTVSDDAITLDGRTAPADLDAFFQLLHLHLTSPRRDTVAFRRYQARMASLVQDRGRDPGTVFRD